MTTLSATICATLVDKPAKKSRERKKEEELLLYVKVNFTTGGGIAFSRATREKTTKSTRRVKKVDAQEWCCKLLGYREDFIITPKIPEFDQAHNACHTIRRD